MTLTNQDRCCQTSFIAPVTTSVAILKPGHMNTYFRPGNERRINMKNQFATYNRTLGCDFSHQLILHQCWIQYPYDEKMLNSTGLSQDNGRILTITRRKVSKLRVSLYDTGLRILRHTNWSPRLKQKKNRYRNFYSKEYYFLKTTESSVI